MSMRKGNPQDGVSTESQGWGEHGESEGWGEHGRTQYGTESLGWGEQGVLGWG